MPGLQAELAAGSLTAHRQSRNGQGRDPQRACHTPCLVSSISRKTIDDNIMI